LLNVYRLNSQQPVRNRGKSNLGSSTPDFAAKNEVNSSQIPNTEGSSGLNKMSKADQEVFNRIKAKLIAYKAGKKLIK
jgi:hypothetical protein